MKALKGGLILEGLSGAGKSRVLAAMRADPRMNGVRVFEEELTFGELMDRLEDRTTDADRWEPLRAIASELPRAPFLLERFHPSYYALMPDRSLYAEIDRRLAALNARIVLLDYAEELIASRAVDRPDRPGTASGLELYFGSREKALAAFRDSRRRRIECVKGGVLPYLIIDTSQSRWDDYGGRILEFWGA